MAVVLRLKRIGAKNNSCFRIVAMDRRSARDGKAIEELGLYDPRHKSENCNLERAEYWLSVGAQPSDTVKAIIKRAKDGKKLSDQEKKTAPSKKATAKMKAEEEAKAAAKAEEEAAKKAEAEAAVAAAEEAKKAEETAVAEETIKEEATEETAEPAAEEVKEEAAEEAEKEEAAKKTKEAAAE